MNYIKNLFALSFMQLILAPLWAQGPNDSGTYYQMADGTMGSELKTAMASIINTHTTLAYSDLWECFKTTDMRSDGKVWDMYSSVTNYTFGTDQSTGSSTKEGDDYNREHSFPKSWFSSEYPMYTDLMHIVPTDSYVNNRRGNYPFGETEGGTYMSADGFSKVGTCTTSGYAGTVFEPADEYKGDFARIYFYMVTCYEDKVSDWSCDMLSGDAYPALSEWALDMLLRWASEDPVSEKETDRNEAVYLLQGNRNPYVDYPGLEQYVWGSLTATAFSYDNYVDPSSSSTGISTVVAHDGTYVDVYRIDGTKIKSKVQTDETLEGLPKGIYVINGKKHAVK